VKRNQKFRKQNYVFKKCITYLLTSMTERSEFHCVPLQVGRDWKWGKIRKVHHIYAIIWCIPLVTVSLGNWKHLLPM